MYMLWSFWVLFQIVMFTFQTDRWGYFFPSIHSRMEDTVYINHSHFFYHSMVVRPRSVIYIYTYIYKVIYIKFLFPLLLCSLWCLQILEYIKFQTHFKIDVLHLSVILPFSECYRNSLKVMSTLIQVLARWMTSITGVKTNLLVHRCLTRATVKRRNTFWNSRYFGAECPPNRGKPPTPH